MTADRHGAMVLAAGEGRRFRPLTERTPKPLIPFLDRPIVGWTLQRLRAAGLPSVAMNAWHLAEQVQDYARSKPEGIALEVIVETELLGTGGGVANARAHLKGAGEGPVVISNGDCLHRLDIAAAIEAHQRSGSVATLVCRPHPEAERYGAVEHDAEGRLTRIASFLGAPSEAREPLVFMGVHIVERELIDALVPEPTDILRTAYSRLFDAGARFGVHRYEGPWFDLGTPARYLEAQRGALDGLLGEDAPPLSCAPESAQIAGGVELQTPYYIGPGARIEAGARIGPYSAIGAGARIGSRAELRDCTVLPDTEVPEGATLQDCILAPGMRLEAQPA